MSLLRALVQELKFAHSQAKNWHYLSQPWESEEINAPGVTVYHGFATSNFYFRDLLERLEQEGYSARAPNYRSWCDMHETAERQAEIIEQRVFHVTRNKESLIGHSQGGLIAVYIAKQYPELIDKVISLGAPFKGTNLAELISFCQAGKQMLPGSDFLQELAEKPVPPKVTFYNIYSQYDHLIIPTENALLKGNNVFNLPAPAEIGHSRLITLHEAMIEILKKRI